MDGLAPKIKGKIKRKWERWLERQDTFTRGEISFRDAWLRVPSLFFYKLGLRANHITLAGAVLLAIWILIRDGLGFNNLKLDIALGLTVGFSDFIDGPMARNNDNVTPEGTLGDYLRDVFYAIYIGRVALDYNLPLYLFLMILGMEALTLYFKWCAFYKYNGGAYKWNKFSEFSEDNFQSTFYDRTQFTLVCLGILVLVLGSAWGINSLYVLGIGSLWASLGFGIATLYKEATWLPTEK